MNEDSSGWTDEELRESVCAYLEMQEHVRSGTPFVKKSYYEALASRFGRTNKAFEYRMQNISYVFSLLGRQWVPGLKPARNVGSTIAGKIEAFISELEGQKQPATALFKVQVREERSRLKGKSPPPKGAKQPKTIDVVVTQHVRDPAVRAWVLNQAAGICECCQLPAPFETADGPFLEVHHVRLLADRGSDTTSNAAALCPNCHRRLHFGLDASVLVDQMYSRVSRLVRE